LRFFAYLLLLAGGAAASAPDVAAYRALVEQDLRLATVGYRLVSANEPFCAKSARNPAMVLHDVAQYPDMKTAFAAFGFPEPIAIAAVVEGGPADAAGLQAGDGLVAIGDDSLNLPDEAEQGPTNKRIAAAKAGLAQSLARTASVQLAIVRGTTTKTATLSPPLVCASDFWVDTQTKIDAGADGDQVRLTTGLMLFASDDDELAAAVAHELSHNILGHRERLKMKRGTKAVLATEIEADRLSVWLMANAGYDPNAALRFAERYGRKTGLGIFSDGTHLRWKNRVRVIQTEIDLMAKTQKQGGLLPPPLLTGG
jgi:beta-barrel assembly-enhancing protease